MKVKIIYEYESKCRYKFWARSGDFYSNGETWEEARENLIASILAANKKGVVVPSKKAEEVEVNI